MNLKRTSVADCDARKGQLERSRRTDLTISEVMHLSTYHKMKKKG